MKKSQLNRIKPTNNNRGFDFVSSGKKQGKDKLGFSFKYFHSECIKTDDFSNYYENGQTARKATSDLFKILKDISNEDVISVFSGPKKRQFHLNEITDKKSIALVENILLKEYGFPERTVEEFEQEYFEIIADGDGGRMIFVREDNIIDPLFIDANHMICPQASRDLNKKMTFSHPGLFCFSQKQNDYYEKEKERNALLEILITDARKGQFNSFDEFLNEWDSIFTE